MALLGLIVLVCAILPPGLHALNLDRNAETGRVFGGRFANAQEFPWMVHMTISKTPTTASVCGAFIISKNYVLTAAHCVCSNATTKAYAKVSDITGRIGNIAKAGATPVKFSQMFVHEKYDDEYNADIALLKLEKGLTKYDKDINKICIANKGKKYPNRQAVVQMGWGRFDNVSSTSPTLKTTSLGYILDKPDCIKEMKSYADPGQLCVSTLRGEKICGGDSGGPLVVINGSDKTAIGIVSFDYCDWCVDDNRFPTIYTEISSYAEWIKSKTNSDKEICWTN